MGNSLYEGQAINVSEAVNQYLINSNILKYPRTIEDFLIKERESLQKHSLS